MEALHNYLKYKNKYIRLKTIHTGGEDKEDFYIYTTAIFHRRLGENPYIFYENYCNLLKGILYQIPKDKYNFKIFHYDKSDESSVKLNIDVETDSIKNCESSMGITNSKISMDGFPLDLDPPKNNIVLDMAHVSAGIYGDMKHQEKFNYIYLGYDNWMEYKKAEIPLLKVDSHGHITTISKIVETVIDFHKTEMKKLKAASSPGDYLTYTVHWIDLNSLIYMELNKIKLKDPERAAKRDEIDKKYKSFTLDKIILKFWELYAEQIATKICKINLF